ncbi:HNH endonuclease [Sporosarcina sp. FSL K6-1522]|uniref:HNH endonuclease n=1 Tax=Sporosarcina sp. FSL K6-1522 TaxID=2921554 RepID=UPI00315B1A5E
MQSFVVMQGQTYQEEKELGMIWSRKQADDGSLPHSWLRVSEVQEGDRIFHYVKGDIVAISVAKTGCQSAPRPTSMPDEEDGYLVGLDYHELEFPINIRSTFEVLLPFMPIKYAPFQEDGSGNQGYLYPCNDELAMKLIELISNLNIYRIDKEQLELAMSPVRQIERNMLIPTLAETETAVKTKIRLGKQQFGQGVFPLWDQTCALCEVALPELLRASYSKPWKDSTDVEQVDSYNGVLLCYNHHALYENGLIAFDGQGRLHISSRIPEEKYEIYSIRPKMKIARKEANKPYFKWHKRHLFNK